MESHLGGFCIQGNTECTHRHDDRNSHVAKGSNLFIGRLGGVCPSIYASLLFSPTSGSDNIRQDMEKKRQSLNCYASISGNYLAMPEPISGWSVQLKLYEVHGTPTLFRKDRFPMPLDTNEDGTLTLSVIG